MTCRSCVNKWKEYYEKKGFQPQDAEAMALKLVDRVEKRLAKTKKEYEPMYLLEKAGEGVTLIRRRPSRLTLLSYLLRQWVFRTNWRASFFWSFKLHRPLWVGMGGNSPYDYTQSCGTPTPGTCNVGVACTIVATCTSLTACQTCPCPAPTDPNSSLTLNTCQGTYKSGCACTSKKCAGTPVCGTCTGMCEYSCNPPYKWNGKICAAPVVTYTPTIIGDGHSWIVAIVQKWRKHLLYLAG